MDRAISQRSEFLAKVTKVAFTRSPGAGGERSAEFVVVIPCRGAADCDFEAAGTAEAGFEEASLPTASFTEFDFPSLVCVPVLSQVNFPADGICCCA